MREILFRGKRKDDKAWVFGDLEHNGKGIPKWVDGYEVEPETIGQFAGLTDKNGKKIFEGDIVKSDDVTHKDEVQISGEVFYVAMQKGCWVVIAKDTAWDFLCTNTKICAVIGNIHDNPELLAT